MGDLMPKPSIYKSCGDNLPTIHFRKVFIFTQPLRSGRIWHKVNFFKRSLTGLNSEFSFSKTICLTKAKEPRLPYYLPIAGGRIISQSECINVTGFRTRFYDVAVQHFNIYATGSPNFESEWISSNSNKVLSPHSSQISQNRSLTTGSGFVAYTVQF